jgi:RND family efflux transporter MFP subunit
VSSRVQAVVVIASVSLLAAVLASCGNSQKVRAENSGNISATGISVAVTKVGKKTMERTITLSSELVPFQEIDVFAKESGYVKELNVDYGTHVQANQTLAVLEIPELQLQLKQDDAAIKNASNRIARADSELGRIEAQHKVMQLQFDRLDGVAKSKPGLVAQQEVDDSQGKALASAAQVEAAKSNLEASQSDLLSAEAKREHDQALFDYSKITAPFAGVVTQRFANLGALMQAGTSSSTQAMPLVRLSQDDLFRLVIPVPESYVHYIHIGDPVSVMVPSLNRTFPGKVARFSVDVKADTRTMHTEVDVPNPQRVLLPGLYADATVRLERKDGAVAIPFQAVDRSGDQTTVDVVGPSRQIETRPVVLGIQTATDAEVLSGLNEGELVVISDRSSLKAGQIVQPKAVDIMPFRSPEEQH